MSPHGSLWCWQDSTVQHQHLLSTTCLLMGELSIVYLARPLCQASRGWQPSGSAAWFTKWTRGCHQPTCPQQTNKQVWPLAEHHAHMLCWMEDLRFFREGREPEPCSTGVWWITAALQCQIQRSRSDPEQNVGQPCIRPKVHTCLLKTISKFDYSTAWQPEWGDKQRAGYLSGL